MHVRVHMIDKHSMYNYVRVSACMYVLVHVCVCMYKDVRVCTWSMYMCTDVSY